MSHFFQNLSYKLFRLVNGSLKMLKRWDSDANEKKKHNLTARLNGVELSLWRD